MTSEFYIEIVSSKHDIYMALCCHKMGNQEKYICLFHIFFSLCMKERTNERRKRERERDRWRKILLSRYELNTKGEKPFIGFSNQRFMNFMNEAIKKCMNEVS